MRLRTILLGVVGLLGVVAFTPVVDEASSHTLYLTCANNALHGGCQSGQDDDIYYKKRQLETAGWCIDHSYMHAHGYVSADPDPEHHVLTVQRYETCKGYLLDRVFFSDIFPSSTYIYDRVQSGCEDGTKDGC